MSVQVLRPDVADLNVLVFNRTIHPELLDLQARTTIARQDFRARLGIGHVGHFIQWQTGGTTLCELVAQRSGPLPRQQRLCDRKLRGNRDETLWLPTGVSYQLSYQVEYLSADVFLQLHDEFSNDCRKATLGHIFAAPNRLAPPAISYLQADVFPHSLLVHSFHTFPATCAVVKTQSLFEFSPARAT